jgi:hypothetical protein
MQTARLKAESQGRKAKVKHHFLEGNLVLFDQRYYPLLEAGMLMFLV